MNLDEPEPTREQKRTFLVVYSNPDASEYLHWLKRSTDHHEMALDCQPNLKDLADLLAVAKGRAEVATAVGSEFDEVWVVYDGTVEGDMRLPEGVNLVTNTPTIAFWLDLHVVEGDAEGSSIDGRYSLAKERAKSDYSLDRATNMYLLVDALLESIRAFRGVAAPPTI